MTTDMQLVCINCIVHSNTNSNSQGSLGHPHKSSQHSKQYPNQCPNKIVKVAVQGSPVHQAVKVSCSTPPTNPTMRDSPGAADKVIEFTYQRIIISVQLEWQQICLDIFSRLQVLGNSPATNSNTRLVRT